MMNDDFASPAERSPLVGQSKLGDNFQKEAPHSIASNTNRARYLILALAGIALFAGAVISGGLNMNSGISESIVSFSENILKKSQSSSLRTKISAPTATKPNFVIILADDLGWSSIGYNDDDMSFATPIMTSLAKQGLTMGNFYAQEVCTPARASLLTGRYPLSVGMQYGMVGATASWGMDLNEVTLAEVFKENGYKTHMLGKWHLGYFSPLYLPTARGFDDFIGYVNGENYYWSKRSPDYPEHVDFMQADADCYYPYNGSDIHTYSTTFYTNHALDIIEKHSSDESMLLYLAFQAVHNPFTDYGKHLDGLPDSYLPDSILDSVNTDIVGRMHQEYVKSLYLLDSSIGQIKSKLEETGLIDNTYIVFISDNGGCYLGGGKNGPLRGSKGSLFEGGVKVDSWIYSPLLQTTGTVYHGLMHISDWFPTMLSLASIDYTPDNDNLLDGVNQVPGWMGGGGQRTTMLYNYYTALEDYDFDIWYNGSFAVRDEKYKLLHTYEDPKYSLWYESEDLVDNDDEISAVDGCAQQFLAGSFKYYLFDLENDPYETTNLYYEQTKDVSDAKTKLYALLPHYELRARTKVSISFNSKAKRVWQEAGNYILPWATTNLKNDAGKSYPSYCK